LGEAERLKLVSAEEAEKARGWIQGSHHRAEKLMDLLIDRLDRRTGARNVRQF
jgi:hypothetical protein